MRELQAPFSLTGIGQCDPSKAWWIPIRREGACAAAPRWQNRPSLLKRKFVVPPRPHNCDARLQAHCQRLLLQPSHLPLLHLSTTALPTHHQPSTCSYQTSDDPGRLQWAELSSCSSDKPLITL